MEIKPRPRVKKPQGQISGEEELIKKDNNFIIGNKGCRYTDIVSTIQENDMYEVHTKWPSIAARLGMRQNTINNLQERLKSQAVSLSDIYGYLLVQWRSKCGDDATLLKLIKILDEIKLSNVSEALRIKFGITEAAQEEVLSSNLAEDFSKILLLGMLSIFFIYIVKYWLTLIIFG